MRPRGFWGTFLRVAAFAAVAFALLWSLLFSLVTGSEFGAVLRFAIWGGIAFGLFFGFLMAFSMKAASISETYQDKQAFLARLNVVLAQMGYHPRSQTESLATYKPSLRAGLLAAEISVQMGDSSCTIVGPNSYIKKLQKRLREQ